MKKINITETWLNTVSASKSGSKLTTSTYRKRFQEFLDFIEAPAEEITNDYENMTEKAFKRKYSAVLRAWISALHKAGFAPNTINGKVTAVLSFFKYSGLPLGFVPLAQMRVIYHNRDIDKDEILKILSISRPRERAFFTVMAQSGLRPVTLCALQLKHLEPDFSEGRIPCRINVPQELSKGKYREYFSFIGEDAVNALKAYFTTRPDLTRESPLFSGYGEEAETHRIVWVFTTKFREAIRTLKEKGEIDYEQKEKGKPAELRLYNLRKWFKKMAYQAGSDLVEFWMGHKGKGVRDHYRPQDVDFHRKIYAEKAMPHLRLETATPSETDKTISELRQKLENREGEILDLRGTVLQLQNAISALEKRVEAWEPTREQLEFIESTRKQWREEQERARKAEKKKKKSTRR